LPWAVLCLLLAFTFWASSRVTTVTRQKNRWHFNNAVLEVESSITDELNNFIGILRGGASLVAVTPNLDSARFQTFVNRLQLKVWYPGVQGVGYAQKVVGSGAKELEQRRRNDGTPVFAIYPPGERPVMYPIVFLQPLDQRNQRALGYDMLSEPVRRAGMKEAATNGPAVSGKVTLVQEIFNEKQPGFLLYVPVFRPGPHPETAAQKEAALQGFIYSPFRSGDFFASVFRTARGGHLHFTIYDGTNIVNSALLYESTNAASAHPWISTNRVLQIPGHQWTIAFETTPAFEEILGGNTAVFVPAAGLLVSILLFALATYLVRQHEELLRRGAALGESEQLHRAISETASDAIILIDEHSRIISVNPSAERIFGHARETLIGQEMTMLMPERMRERHRHGLKRYLENGERHIPWTGVELPGLHKDGHELALEISFAEIRSNGAAGERIFTGTIRDITERKRAREEIQTLNRELENRVKERTAELQETNSQLESFIYSVAHDLRAPLRSIRGYADILVEDHGPKLEQSAHTDIQHIIGSAGRMDSLIVDLLNYSQVSRGKVNLAPVGLDKMLSELRTQFEHEIQRTHGSLSILSPLPTVLAHESTLRQALFNLLSNAFKFVKPGERPEVCVGSESSPDGRVRIWVEDKGLGIDPEHHERIFGVFERLDQKSYPGTGIGLAIVRRAIERMGGRVGLESVPGKGSRFYIELQKA
jgi:PAS domain S-box-containing protein